MSGGTEIRDDVYRDDVGGTDELFIYIWMPWMVAWWLICAVLFILCSLGFGRGMLRLLHIRLAPL